MIRSIRTGCMGALCALACNASAATVTEYSAGHADIGIAISGGELILQYQFGAGAILDGVSQVTSSNVEPSQAYVLVPDIEQFPGAVAWLGTEATDPIWTLSQSNVPGSPFLGISSEDLAGFGLSSLQLTMTGFSGPGEFALWQGGFSPTIFWQTLDGIGENLGDDILPFGIGGHDHHNYGFTQEGIYDVELTATANLAGVGPVSDVETFRFVVGTAVPEPGSLSALATLLGVGFLGRRRRVGTASDSLGPDRI